MNIVNKTLTKITKNWVLVMPLFGRLSKEAFCPPPANGGSNFCSSSPIIPLWSFFPVTNENSLKNVSFLLFFFIGKSVGLLLDAKLTHPMRRTLSATAIT